MITWMILFSLAATYPHFTFSSVLEFAPVKITLNDNYNGDVQITPGTVGVNGTPRFPSSFVHQGANFFFNPQLLISPGSIPTHVETLIDSLKEKNSTSSTTASTPEEPMDHTEAPTALLPPPPPIIPENAPTIVISEPIVIPNPPELPPLSTTELIVTEDTEETKKPVDVFNPESPPEMPESPKLEDEPVDMFPGVPEMPPAPELPPLELPEFPTHLIVEETLKPKPYVVEIIHIDNVVIPKPPKIFGVLTSVPLVSHVPAYIPVAEKCNPCLEQELPIILPNILKPSGESSKTILLLPAESKFPLHSNLPLDVVIAEKFNKVNELVLPTVCAHNIIAERIVPNIMLSERYRRHLKVHLSVAGSMKYPVK